MNVSTLLSAFPRHAKSKTDSLSMATASTPRISNLDENAVLNRRGNIAQASLSKVTQRNEASDFTAVNHV